MHSKSATRMLKTLRNPFSISVWSTLEGGGEEDVFMARPLRVGRDGARGYVRKESEGPGRGLEAGVGLRMQKMMDTEGLCDRVGSQGFRILLPSELS